MKKNPAPVSPRKSRGVPKSTVSFCEYLRAITKRINGLRKYIAGVGKNDSLKKTTLAAMVDERQAALRNRLPSVDLEVVIKLCRELKIDKELGLPPASDRLPATPAPAQPV